MRETYTSKRRCKGDTRNENFLLTREKEWEMGERKEKGGEVSETKERRECQGILTRHCA